MKYQFIEAQRAHYPVRRLCRVLGVAVSGYYAASARGPSACARRQGQLSIRIRVIHAQSRATYGAPRVHAELIAQGERCCKNTVAKLMRRAGIVPKTVRRFRVTTDSRHTLAAPNLLGRVFMKEMDCPFRTADAVLEALRDRCKVILVDFHAEITAEYSPSGFCRGPKTLK